MRTYSFDVMGRRRTYLDFYLGFGHHISILTVAQAVLLWQLAKTGPTSRPLVRTLLTANIAGALVISAYMFIIPIVMAWCIVVCLAMAWRLTRRSPEDVRDEPSRHGHRVGEKPA
jgi:hypothetical protein